jgi:drug/metabolite transporter (DMT)-like permease
VAFSFACIGAYVLLLGVASFVERPVGKSFNAFQLNVLIRGGGLVVGVAALLVVHGIGLPAPQLLLAGVGIGVIAGSASICYCLALDYLPVSVVVAVANLYIVVTILLGVAILHEAITPLKIASLVMTLIGVLVLSYTPGRHGVQPGKPATQVKVQLRPLAILATYVALVGISTFLEKPALQGLDATQLNALQGMGMGIVASIGLAVRGGSVQPTKHALGGALVGAMIGVGSIFYFLGLQGLPVSVAAATSNAYMVVTILLSTLVLHEVLAWPRRIGIVVTLLGVTLLAYSAG